MENPLTKIEMKLLDRCPLNAITERYIEDIYNKDDASLDFTMLEPIGSSDISFLIKTINKTIESHCKQHNVCKEKLLTILNLDGIIQPTQSPHKELRIVSRYSLYFGFLGSNWPWALNNKEALYKQFLTSLKKLRSTAQWKESVEKRKLML